MTNLAAAVELKWYENQDWTGLTGAQAFQLIERHAEGWPEIDEAMSAWLKANHRPPVAGLAELTDEKIVCLYDAMHRAEVLTMQRKENALGQMHGVDKALIEAARECLGKVYG